MATEITAAVRRMCMETNCNLPADVRRSIEAKYAAEKSETGKEILDLIMRNYEIAAKEGIPICQDTGITCVFVEIGQDVNVRGELGAAINEGVRQGYNEGFLRKSMVADPIRRVNTGDNTPAMIHYDIVPGDGLKITVAPKGFGCENMSRIKMLVPSDGLEGVKKFIVETVEIGGPNPCPPLIVGVGIGGTFDVAALLAKKSLLRETDDVHPDPFYADLENELLESINALGIGPQGYGGLTTALAVKICVTGTHIAGLPVAVNINCHAARHISEVL